nr:hypothetical protein [Oceanococcus sp. HetDA_MAG_MS8]
MQETGRVLSALSAGDLSERIETDYNGDLGDLKDSVNSTVAVLNEVINKVAGVLAAIADGDLSQSVDGSYGGIFNKLKDDTNSCSEQLADIVQRIQTATETITNASKEIADGNADLSRRTEQQSQSLEETASSMEELIATVRQNTENAMQADQLAQGAAGVASEGGEVVGNVVKTMSEINESSRKIVDIISVIDAIAFQTNILALNAAVEAARAGEQGRGFAVVASEVRSLAQRSAGAAKEIKQLIGNSVEKVDAGSKLVEKAGKTMDEIVQSVKRVTDIMGEISAASQEQTSGIEQVNQSINSMDEVTQQNAALVEEATASAQMLAEQATGLADSVAAFKLKRDSKGRVAVTKVPDSQPLVDAGSMSNVPAAMQGKQAQKSGNGHGAQQQAVNPDSWSSF